MFHEVYDDDAPAVVWRFAGQENSPDCHARWLQGLPRVVAAVNGRRGASLLIIDEGNPAPPPAMRDEIRKVASGLETTSPLAVVTTSAVARTIIAGIRLTGLLRYPIRGFATVDDAVAWLQTEEPTASAVVPELVAEIEARVARGR